MYQVQDRFWPRQVHLPVDPAMLRRTIEAEVTQKSEAVNILIKHKEPDFEQVEEVFRPSASIETALYLMIAHGAAGCLLFREVLLWLLSIIIRAGLASYLINVPKHSEESEVEFCKVTCKFVLMSGMFLFAMQRVKEALDVLYTLLYFNAKSGSYQLVPAPEEDPAHPPPPRIAVKSDHPVCLQQCWLTLIMSVKFAVEAYVTVAGEMFLAASSSNQEVILNCLAVTFVSEIDEKIFECFSGERAKRLVKNQPDRELRLLVGTHTSLCNITTCLLKWFTLIVACLVACLRVYNCWLLGVWMPTDADAIEWFNATNSSGFSHGLPNHALRGAAPRVEA